MVIREVIREVVGETASARSREASAGACDSTDAGAARLAHAAALAASVPDPEIPVITLGDIVIDFSAKTVTRNGERIPLTAAEFEMLTTLARHRGEVVPRDVLEKANRQDGSEHVSNVVDVIILRLRRKLGRDVIATRRGQGFIIEVRDGRA